MSEDTEEQARAQLALLLARCASDLEAAALIAAEIAADDAERVRVAYASVRNAIRWLPRD